MILIASFPPSLVPTTVNRFASLHNFRYVPNLWLKSIADVKGWNPSGLMENTVLISTYAPSNSDIYDA
ncbi:hypothetical protein RDI58_010138 [Solanum bulbocastanum]|uniref:Uncharacterized protein n=1 Tax=Solanum bulbocastanum TaxID=147425 RepID=A0AAN8TTG7_SOLBU